MWNLKKGTNEPTDKTETESQMYKTTYSYQGGRQWERKAETEVMQL